MSAACHQTGLLALPFASQSDHNPVTLLICLLLDLGAKADSAHDAITKFLVENGLVSVAVILDDLVESIYERLFWRHLDQPRTIREVCELSLAECLFGNVEQFGQVLDVIVVGLSMAVEQCSAGNFIAVQGLGDGFKAEVLLLLCSKEKRSALWQPRLQ